MQNVIPLMPNAIYLYVLEKFCTSYKHVCRFLLMANVEAIIHLEQQLYLITITWKYGGIVFGTEVS